MDLSHLRTEEARQQAMLPKDRRIHIVQKDHWYDYPRGRAAIDHMEWLYNHAKIDRMPNLQLIGESMSGKTRLLNRFALELHPSSIDRTLEADYRPVVMFDTQTSVSAKAMLEEMLIAVNAPFSGGASISKLMSSVEKIYARLNVRVLILDEIQHLVRGSSKQQLEMRDQIKLIGNRLRIPIITAGTHEASNAFSNDAQLNNRFKRIELKRWHISNREDLEYLVAILKSWQESCPLQKPSNLVDQKIISLVIDSTGGLFGHIIDYLKMASQYAIRSGEECISLKTFSKMGWIVPTEASSKYIAVA